MISQQMRFIAAMLLFLPSMVAQAQWSSDPAVNNPICLAGNLQRNPKVISDGKGGAIICWHDERFAQNFPNIYVQRISREGFVRWTINGVALSPASNSQSKPDIISDDAGGAIVVWTDARNGDKDIYAQRIDSSGNLRWSVNGVAVAFGSAHQVDAKLATDGNHGAIVTWSAGDGTSMDGHIYAQRIDGTGQLLWNPEVNLSFSDQFETAPCIASDGIGGAYVAWSFYNNTEYDVYAQRLDANGGARWQNGGIGIATASGAQDKPSLLADGNGKAFLGYIDYGSGSNSTQHIAVLNPDGSTAASLQVASTSGRQANLQMSIIGTGLLGFAWDDGRQSGKTRVYAQIIDNTGKKSWAADGVAVSSRTGDQVTPSITTDGNGGVIVSWEDKTRGALESDIYAQRLSATGTALWPGTGVAVGTAARMAQVPSMLSDGQSGAIVTWEDYRASFSNPEIYASRILADGTFPVGPPLLTFSSRSVAFGVVSVGSPSIKNITLSNTGGAPVTIASITSSDPHFSLTPDESTIAPNRDVPAVLRFEPTSKDALTAYIVVHSNSVFSPDTVVVTGSGSASAAMELDRLSLNFTSVMMGSSKPLALKISNTGNDTLVISSISSNNPNFTVAVASLVVAPGDAFIDTVRFSPTAIGPVTGVLTLTSNAPDSPKTLQMLGTGTPEVKVTMTIDPAEFDFGDVYISSHKDTTLTVTNTGNDTLRITSFKSGDFHFTVVTPITVIAPGAGKTFTLRFAPTAVGPLSTVFTVTSNAETSPVTIAVQGTGREVVAVRSLQTVPGAFTLYQNYPNPFHPSTTIRYDLETSAPVRVTVHNALGQVAATLVDETQRPGSHIVQWTPTSSVPGVYFLMLRVGAHVAFGRMVLMQ